ncbi:hypothetical protein RKD55_004578 [Rossellomorea marisflavi]
MKSVMISAIKWAAKFEQADGSYYDYVADAYSPSETKEKEITSELLSKGWRKIDTNNGMTVFEKERHVLRISRIWG